MAEHGRHVDPVLALDEMQVAVADSGGAGADQDLPRSGIVHLYFFNLKGSVHFTEYRCFHSSSHFAAALIAPRSLDYWGNSARLSRA